MDTLRSRRMWVYFAMVCACNLAMMPGCASEPRVSMRNDSAREHEVQLLMPLSTSDYGPPKSAHEGWRGTLSPAQVWTNRDEVSLLVHFDPEFDAPDYSLALRPAPRSFNDQQTWRFFSIQRVNDLRIRLLPNTDSQAALETLDSSGNPVNHREMSISEISWIPSFRDLVDQ